MVVGKHAAVDSGGGETIRVLRAYSVIYAFRRKVLTARDGCFEIDDARIRLSTVQLVEGRAPNVRRNDRPRDCTICLLGETHIVRCRVNIALVDCGVAWARQQMIDAPSEHDVAASK